MPKSDHNPSRDHPSTHEDPDTSLIERAQAGDQNALGQLLTRHADRLYRTIYAIVRERTTTEDLTQDVMLKIIRHIQRFDGRARFTTWITRIAINTCYTHLRNTFKRASVSLDTQRPRSAAQTTSSSQAAAITDPREPTPPDSVQAAEDHDDLIAAINDLDPDQRTILVLRDQQDMDYAALAELFEIPEGTIKSRLFRARRALRESIERVRAGRRSERSGDGGES